MLRGGTLTKEDVRIELPERFKAEHNRSKALAKHCKVRIALSFDPGATSETNELHCSRQDDAEGVAHAIIEDFIGEIVTSVDNAANFGMCQLYGTHCTPQHALTATACVAVRMEETYREGLRSPSAQHHNDEDGDQQQCEHKPQHPRSSARAATSAEGDVECSQWGALEKGAPGAQEQGLLQHGGAQEDSPCAARRTKGRAEEGEEGEARASIISASEGCKPQGWSNADTIF